MFNASKVAITNIVVVSVIVDMESQEAAGSVAPVSMLSVETSYMVLVGAGRLARPSHLLVVVCCVGGPS